MSSTRHKSRRTLCQGRTVRACVHSVGIGILCGYMPNSSLLNNVTIIGRGFPHILLTDWRLCRSQTIPTLPGELTLQWDVSCVVDPWVFSPRGTPSSVSQILDPVPTLAYAFCVTRQSVSVCFSASSGITSSPMMKFDARPTNLYLWKLSRHSV